MMKFLLYICISLVSTFGFTYLFCKLNNIKPIINIKILLIFILGVLFITFVKYFELSNISIVSYFIFFPVLFYSLSKMPFKKVLVYALIIWAIGVIMDLFSALIVSLICTINNINFNSYQNLFSISLSFLVCIIFILLGNFKSTNKLLNKLIKAIYDIQYFDLALIIFSAFIFLVGLNIYLNFENIHSDFFLFIILLLAIFIFILLIMFKINGSENKKYLETLKENNDFYIKVDDENRIFKHNLMAKLSSIKSVSNKKAIALIDDFVIKTKKSINYANKIKSVPYGLNGIIYQKTYPYLEDINFKITNDIDYDIFKVLKPRRYNVLVEKLVVSLDNAIEACLNSKSKIVVINLYDDEEYIYIEIKNSFANNIDIDNLGNLNYSTKGRKRGLGLFSILRDNEAVLKVKVINNYFISIISARKQK